jgi:hypothetical protein
VKSTVVPGSQSFGISALAVLGGLVSSAHGACSSSASTETTLTQTAGHGRSTIPALTIDLDTTSNDDDTTTTTAIITTPDADPSNTQVENYCKHFSRPFHSFFPMFVYCAVIIKSLKC